LTFSGALVCQDAAEASDSAVHDPEKRSMWTIQPSFSVLEPASMTPGRSSIGLARIGPSTPAGSTMGADHVRPASADVRARPHQRDGLGPTL
jgi:hypothetical protein